MANSQPPRKNNAPKPNPSGDDASEAPKGERIAKRLARAGVASRRDAEAMILEGRVTINGKKLLSPAVNVTEKDAIAIDGAAIGPIERTRLWLFHKKAGTVTTNKDPEGRPTVFDRLPSELPRVLTVGRLDINTEGLLLLTNDGGLARELEMPTTGWTRRYRVRIHGKPDEAALAKLKDGIAVDGVLYGAIDATIDRIQGSNAWLNLALKEGKNREIKNVLGALGLEVTRLIRVSFGPFSLDDLESGSVREIRGRVLREQLGEVLIERAGCNFDAPVKANFSNKPVAERRSEPAERGPKKPFNKGAKERFAEKKEDGLARLDTQKRDEQKPRDRSSYVWMAPGGRPTGKRKDGDAATGEKKGKRDKPFRTKGRGTSSPTTKSPSDKSPSERSSTGKGYKGSDNKSAGYQGAGSKSAGNKFGGNKTNAHKSGANKAPGFKGTSQKSGGNFSKPSRPSKPNRGSK